MSEDREDKNLDEQAEEIRHLHQEVNNQPEGSREWEKAKFELDKTYTRFIDDSKRETKWDEKYPNKYNLSSGQMTQAGSEYQSEMGRKIFTGIIKNQPGEMEHYINSIAPFVMTDACRSEAKAKRRKSKTEPGKQELWYPEESGDIPVNPEDANSATIIDTTADNGKEDNEIKLDLELICGDSALKGYPDITLSKCLTMLMNGDSVQDIAHALAPQDLTEQQFKAFYSKLIKWLKGKKVKEILEHYLRVKIVTFLMLIISVNLILASIYIQAYRS